MRLLVIDARVTDASCVLKLLQDHPADRRFVMGGAAYAFSTYARALQQTQDEAYLDAVAAYFTETDHHAAPERPASSPVLNELFAIHDETEGLAPLTVTDRAVEMSGNLMGMVVPNRAVLLRSGEAISNAAFWIAGGERAPSCECEEDIPVISPGQLDATGGAALIEVKGRVLTVTAFGDTGETVHSERFTLQNRTRFRLQGS